MWPDFGKPTIYTQVKKLEYLTLTPYNSNPQANQKYLSNNSGNSVSLADLSGYLTRVIFQAGWIILCHLCVDGRFSKIQPLVISANLLMLKNDSI